MVENKQSILSNEVPRPFGFYFILLIIFSTTNLFNQEFTFLEFSNYIHGKATLS